MSFLGSHSSTIVAVLCVWFGSSIIFNITAGMLISLVPQPEDMTLIELIVTVLVGTANLLARGMQLMPGIGSDWPSKAGLGALHLLNCRAFIIALSFVPIAFAQTVRATNPLWVVVICMLLGERFSWRVLASLVPLIGGFALVVGADPRGVPIIGLLACLCSVNAQALVNMWSKRTFSENTKLHAYQIQYASCFFALVILLPMWVMRGGVARLSAHCVALDYNSQCKLLAIIVVDGCLYLTEQCASFSAVTMLHPLTFSVIDTIRRLTIVTISGFWFQGTPCSLLNALGIVLVMYGGLQYAYVKELEARRAEDAKKIK